MLTLASRRFFEQPPPGYSDHPLLTPRGALFVATQAQRDQLERHWEVLRAITSNTYRFSADPAHAIHQGYLCDMRRAGGTLVCGADVRPIGLQPRRRSAFLFKPPAGLDTHASTGAFGKCSPNTSPRKHRPMEFIVWRLAGVREVRT